MRVIYVHIGKYNVVEQGTHVTNVRHLAQYLSTVSDYFFSKFNIYEPLALLKVTSAKSIPM